MLQKLSALQGIEKIDKQTQLKINGGRKKCRENGVCISCGQECAEIECVMCF